MTWGEADVHRAAAARRLALEFEGAVSREMIERELEASFGRWEDARITTFIPVLAERATRERLVALVRSVGT